MDLYKLAAMHVKAIVDLLNQHGPTDKIVLAAYSDREEYNELHKAPGELSYDDHQRLLRIVSESLVGLKLHDRVVFQEIDSAEYYHWLAENKLSDTQAARARFANEKYGRENKE
ncbi:hypothetical protein C5Q97_04565 [Victivallales bacterium CCUG 44730]|nr:hypothetical protein C5Q97_04565 [Victivallales bacterium CCUG 44730]